MPKPKLPDEQRKDTIVRVRFLESETKTIVNMAKYRNCKTISQYIRMLIKDDINSAFGAYGLPELPKRQRK